MDSIRSAMTVQVVPHSLASAPTMSRHTIIRGTTPQRTSRDQLRQPWHALCARTPPGAPGLSSPRVFVPWAAPPRTRASAPTSAITSDAALTSCPPRPAPHESLAPARHSAVRVAKCDDRARARKTPWRERPLDHAGSSALSPEILQDGSNPSPISADAMLITGLVTIEVVASPERRPLGQQGPATQYWHSLTTETPASWGELRR